MKRFLALAALVLGLASCQTEPEGLNVNVGGEVDTVVTVTLPETTRANSAEGAFANIINNEYYTGQDMTIRYVFQVFYGEGENQKAVQKQVYYTDNMTASFPVRLVPGRDYNFVAWADIVAQPEDAKMGKALPYNEENVVENHYNVANLKEVKFNSIWNAMDETRDAYSGFHNTNGGEKYTGSSSINIRMTRPFAKLRVITTDMVELKNLGIIPTSAKVTYSAFSHESFNALDGTYSGEISTKTHTYTIADYADFVNDTEKKDSHKVLFTDYFFADDNDVVKFELDVYEADVDNQTTTTLIKHNDFKTDIPVQRNYLTTIQGNVLTDGNNVKVTVENNGAFAGEKVEKIVEVGNATDLKEAIDNSTEETTIVLGGNIDLGDLFGVTRAAATLPIVIPEGKVVALDLNGFNLTTPFVEGSTTNHAYAFENHGSLTIQDSKGNGQIKARGIYNYGTMTLKSGIINACDANGGYGVRNYDGAVFVMDGGSIVTSNEDGDDRVSGNYDASPLRVDANATATIKGGNITNVSNYTFAIDNYGTTTIEGGTFTSVHSTIANAGTMTIKGDATTIKCEGEYTSAHPIYANGEASNTYVNGGNFIGNNKASCYYVAAEKNTNVYISGGIFTNAGQAAFTGEGNIVVTGGQFDKDPSKRVVKGYVAEKNGDVFVVSEIALEANFADNSWDKIILACQNDIVPETWAVGNKKAMTIGGKDYQIRILGKNHDTYTAGGKAPLTFQIAEVYGAAPMNATQTNTTGWSGSKMRTETMGKILSAMPDEVKNAITAVNKETLNGTRDGLETTSDKLFLLSEVEVNGSVYFSNNFAEGSRYAYFGDVDSMKLNATYWLRGPGKSNDIGYTQINMSGYMANGSAEYDCGVVFGFCF